MAEELDLPKPTLPPKKLGKPMADSDVVNDEPRVLLIGYGWVGQYMGKYFTQAHYVESDDVIKLQLGEPATPYSRYDLAIISVPTPMNPETGQCDTSIVESVVKKYKDIVDIFLIKSTVEIGTSDRLQEQYGVPVCMSPEYVGETLGHPMVGVDYTQFQIIGGDKYASEAVSRMFMKVLHADAQIFLVSAIEAEIIKYCENYWIMRRVDFWNDVFQIGSVYNASFQALRNGLTLDPRLNRTHSNVYANNRGWGGKCLPKDMNALAFKFRKLGHPLKTLEHLIEKNADIRKDYENNNRLMPEKPLWQK